MITPWMIAVHEASHAVAALANGFTVPIVTIDAAVAEAVTGDESFARVEGGLCSMWGDPDDLGHDVPVFHLAGHAGVEEILGVPTNAFILDFDNRQAHEMAQKVGADVSLCRESARRLVRTHREVILRLAAELLVRKTLKGKDVEEIFYYGQV